MAGYTKAIDVTIDVVKKANDAGNSQYQLTMTIHLQINKPKFAPSSGFSTIAKKIALQQFQKQTDSYLPDLEKLL